MGKPSKRASAKPAKPIIPAPFIPAPFIPAPPELEPLLSTLDKDTVYIVHVDTHPWWFKRRVFGVPVVLNVLIALLVIWRAYTALPWYTSILLSVLGNANHTTLYWSQLTWPGRIKSVLWRTCVFMLDFVLFRIVALWPWGFFCEGLVEGKAANPAAWRFKIGFRDEEVYVRQSRGWGAKDLLGEAEGGSGRAGEESPFFRTRVLPAIESARLRTKTGYMLMDGDFDLDFGAMVGATRLVDRKDVPLDALRKSVLVFVGSEESGEWAVWDCWKLDESSETEAREKIVLFKDRLTAMGKEELFFKWVELVQYESSAPGGFTKERQIATAQKAKKLFEDQGVDFEEFERSLGGLGGLPGMTA